MNSKTILAITKRLMYIRENAEALVSYAYSLDKLWAVDKKDLIFDEVDEIIALLESEVKDD